MGIGSIILQLRSGSLRIPAAPKLVVERGIAVTEQDDEGPDAKAVPKGNFRTFKKAATMATMRPH